MAKHRSASPQHPLNLFAIFLNHHTSSHQINILNAGHLATGNKKRVEEALSAHYADQIETSEVLLVAANSMTSFDRRHPPN